MKVVVASFVVPAYLFGAIVWVDARHQSCPDLNWAAVIGGAILWPMAAAMHAAAYAASPSNYSPKTACGEK